MGSVSGPGRGQLKTTVRRVSTPCSRGRPTRPGRLRRPDIPRPLVQARPGSPWTRWRRSAPRRPLAEPRHCPTRCRRWHASAMTTDSGLVERLRRLEVDLVSPEVWQSRAELEARMSPDFLEIGSSGILSREGLISIILGTDPGVWHSEDVVARELSPARWAGRGRAVSRVGEGSRAPARPFPLDGEAPPGQRPVQGRRDDHGTARVDPRRAAVGTRWRSGLESRD